MSTKPGLPTLFVTGTDTNVGKTHVTCLIARQSIARGMRVAAYKPVCSGAKSSESNSSATASVHHWDDIDQLKSAIGGDWADDVICPQRFLAPLAPPIAARLEGRTVDFQLLVDGAERFDGVDLLLIEGAGGWLSPVTETKTVADLARAVNVPILIVARSGLGTINHTLMTIESVRSRGLIVAGVILNDVVEDQNDQSARTNGAEIEARSGAPVLGVVHFGNGLELHDHGQPVSINWRELASRSLREPVALEANLLSATQVASCPAGLIEKTFIDIPDQPADQIPGEDLGWPASANFLAHLVQSKSPVATVPNEQSEVTNRDFPRSETPWLGLNLDASASEFQSPIMVPNLSSSAKDHSRQLTLLLIVGSYASLLTIFLIYLTFFKRPNQLESLPDLMTVQQHGGRAIVPRPENHLPGGHQLRLGQTRQYGNIRVTPLRVTRGPLQFTDSANTPPRERLDSEPVLKLWLKFENASDSQTITPIDTNLMYFRRILNDRIASYNVIFKNAERTQRDSKFYYTFDRLTADSEWHIAGQLTNQPLKPRESLETFIPSEEKIDDLSGDLIWRVHFRKGHGPTTGNGVTTLIDVRFNNRDIKPDAA